MDCSSLLQHLNEDELKDLLNGDGSKIEDMIKDEKQLKVLEQERDNLIAINKSLAEYNLSKEPQFKASKQSLIDQHKQLTELRSEVEKKKDQVMEASRQTSLDTTLALLQTAAAESEEESDLIANQLLSGEITVDTFLSTFLPQRKAAHLRRIKTDKLIEYVREQSSNSGRSGQNSHSYNPGVISPVRHAPAPPPGRVPYPVAGIPGMPQPMSGYTPFGQPPYGPR